VYGRGRQEPTLLYTGTGSPPAGLQHNSRANVALSCSHHAALQCTRTKPDCTPISPPPRTPPHPTPTNHPHACLFNPGVSATIQNSRMTGGSDASRAQEQECSGNGGKEGQRGAASRGGGEDSSRTWAGCTAALTLCHTAGSRELRCCLLSASVQVCRCRLVRTSALPNQAPPSGGSRRRRMRGQGQ
jgi:hypothetical protein